MLFHAAHPWPAFHAAVNESFIRRQESFAFQTACVSQITVSGVHPVTVARSRRFLLPAELFQGSQTLTSSTLDSFRKPYCDHSPKLQPRQNSKRNTSIIHRSFVESSAYGSRKCFNFQIVSFRLLLRGLLRYLDCIVISQVPEVARVAIGIAAFWRYSGCVSGHQCRLSHVYCTSSGALVVFIPDTCWSALIVWPCTAVNYGSCSKPPGNKVRYLVLSQPQSLLLLSRDFIGRKGTFDPAAIGRHVLGVVFLSNLVQNREQFFLSVLYVQVLAITRDVREFDDP